MFSPLRKERRGGGATNNAAGRQRPSTPKSRPVIPDRVKADNRKAEKRTGHSTLARKASMGAQQRLSNNELERVNSARRKKRLASYPEKPQRGVPEVGAPGSEQDSEKYGVAHYNIKDVRVPVGAPGPRC